MSTLRITIVGAGLAGLSLARCLKANGIATRILERNSHPSSSKSGNYGITLQPRSYQPLLRILQVEESSFREQVLISLPDTGKPIKSDDAIPSIDGAASGTLRCHRRKLEEWLREGLVITSDFAWKGGAMQNSEEEPDANDVMIGADGVHSEIRKTSLPHMHLKVLPYVVIYGTRLMTYTRYHDTLAQYMQLPTLEELRQDRVLLRISVAGCDLNRVTLNYTYSRPAREDDTLYTPDRSPSEARIIPEDFFRELKGLTGLGPAFVEIFDSRKVREDRLTSWLMRSGLPSPNDIQDLAKRGTLLIGDAMHAMPILGGEGANMAIQDAMYLAEHITQHGIPNFSAVYEDRYALWRTAVKESERQLSAMHIPQGAISALL